MNDEVASSIVENVNKYVDQENNVYREKLSYIKEGNNYYRWSDWKYYKGCYGWFLFRGIENKVG